MTTVVISHEPVELYKILKFEGLSASGGEAKLAIDEGAVAVNGEIEYRRRRKMYSGDTLSFAGEDYQLTLAGFGTKS